MCHVSVFLIGGDLKVELSPAGLAVMADIVIHVAEGVCLLTGAGPECNAALPLPCIRLLCLPTLLAWPLPLCIPELLCALHHAHPVWACCAAKL